MRIPWSEPDLAALVRFADCVAVLAAGVLAYLTRFVVFGDYQPRLAVYALVIGTLMTAQVFHLLGVYDQRPQPNSIMHLGRAVAAWAIVILLLLALGFLTQTAEDVSRIWVLLWLAYGAIALILARTLLARRIDVWQQRGVFTRNVAIVGAGDLGLRFVDYLRRVSGNAVRIFGVFDDRRTRIPERVGDVPVLGTVDDLVRFARGNMVDQVVITLPPQAEQRLLETLNKLRDLPVDISICPVVFAPPGLMPRRVTLVGGLPLLDVLQRPYSRWGYLAKSIEDYVLATALLIVAAPLMLAIALAVRLDSPGPIIFRQKRYGFNNGTIEIFKFRTMQVDRDERDHAMQARRNDPRLTRVGRFLRRTSLDELPQLFNVLRGEMSVVGPRPHMVEHNQQYAALLDAYLARHRVKPGITGWAQVNGWRGETDTLEKMERRLSHDLYYIENWSLIFDLQILARTLFVGLIHPNAY
ncbi:MAG TPA: undecaprenyl-phosphate glucose phosphotransferase [Geminicoccaceae bacterium]|nr:undecaprenyl-phosphate glucose phosphotransferase [Geminicoccaceae bacterium]